VPTVSWRMLRFPDQTQVRVNCLNEILAELYSEGRQVNKETAEEIINRLEAKKNYIPSSDRARKEYAYVLLKEYRKYVKGRADNNR
jgi:predicted transcriptional regulator